jgi:GAF domain/PilZ domain/Sel1 repeat
MSAIAQASRPVSLNRRRRVRQKVHAPAYASFSGAAKSEMLDLHEVLNISEIGVAVQCPSPMEIDQQVDMCLDLVEAGGQISVTARVVWSDLTGRAGLGFPALVGASRQRLREWLFLNAMASASNAASSAAPRPVAPNNSFLRPNYTDTLSAASAVQREAESLGSDLEAVLFLVASRSQSLLRTSGAAIALPANDPGLMICRASAGPIAPPVGANLQVGSGFSGECVRTGRVLRCDDAETDALADRESCRSLGIRSMLAVPIRMGEKVIGLIEVFSAEAGAFGENDSMVLQRFAETILAAIKRAARESLTPPAPKPFVAPPGSVLFAYPPEESGKKDTQQRANQNEGKADREIEMAASADDDNDKVGGIRLPLANLYLLIGTAATIFLVLGFLLAPWIQPWIQRKFHVGERGGEQTVLASSKAPADVVKSDLAADSGNLDQLLALARRGNPVAENALGLLYAEGDEKQAVIPDESEAARWFTSAAEHGNVPAQSKLGSLYWSGRGVPQDSNRAYFWTVLARASGDEASKALAPFIATRLSLAQRAAIEQQAEQWLQQHESTKPRPGH